ncbi:MAG: DUF2851 family protein, partial [Chitinophagaceae bacterium]
NTDQGPDFSGAVVMVDGLRWVGAVELHLKTGDWLKHRHQHDPNYGSVILHVVWQHDTRVNDLPVIELGERVSGLLLEQYGRLMRKTAFIPCNADNSHLGYLAWMGWKDRLLFERLGRKSEMIKSFNRSNGNNWEESCWWLLARNFGYKVNADAFEMIARSIPVRVMARIRHSLTRLTALLLGQAGLLEAKAREPAARLLQLEYHLLKARYGLQPVLPRVQFLRMRPRNFPAVRLAQLAALLHRQGDLHEWILTTSSLKEMKMKFRGRPAAVRTGNKRQPKNSLFRAAPIGDFMVRSLVINTVVPVLFFYSELLSDETLGHRAIDWLRQLERENNSITDTLERIGFLQQNAFDSQAMLELKTRYCDQRKCLECAVGYSILNPRHPSRL